MTQLDIESSTVLKRRTDARYRNIAGEGVIVRQQAGEVLVVSEVGARVLDLVGTGLSFGELLTELGREYETDRDTLERDLIAYLRELFDAGILEPA
jgi:hypothetical protein